MFTNEKNIQKDLCGIDDSYKSQTVMPLYKIWRCELTFYKFDSVMHFYNMYCITNSGHDNNNIFIAICEKKTYPKTSIDDFNFITSYSWFICSVFSFPPKIILNRYWRPIVAATSQ